MRWPTGKRMVGVFAASALLLLGLAFGPYLGGEYVWDDVHLVEENPHLLGPGGLRRILTLDTWQAAGKKPGQAYHPLPMLSFWLQARVTGLSLIAFRLVNVMVHGLCGLLFLLWLRREQTSPALVLLGPLVFLVHPSVTEPVMWLTGRHDALGVLCCLGALLTWPARSGGRRLSRALLAGLLCAAAALCKELLVVMPAILVLRQLLVLGGEERGEPVRSLWPLVFPFAGVAAVLAVRAGLGIPSGSDQLHAPLTEHLVHFAGIVAHYLGQLLTFGNGRTIESYTPLSSAHAAMVWVGLALAVGLCVWGWRRRLPWGEGALLGLGWCLLALLPLTISLPLTGLHGNRYTYLPLLGLLVAVGWPLAAWTSRWRPRLRQIGVVCVCLGLIALALKTATEARRWRDDLTLYGADLHRAPEDGKVLYHFGHAVRRREGCAAALPYFVAATERAPRYGRAWHNVAGCLINLGRYAAAVAPATRALRLAPADARRRYNLGAALVLSGQLRRGIRQLELSLRLEPGNQKARRLLARARALERGDARGP